MARRTFEVPDSYLSEIIGRIKRARAAVDPRRRDFTPLLLDLGPVRFRIPRHFGFCYGVENAIEIAWKTVRKYPDRRVFLLSEMIHNPRVNADLAELGVQFLMKTDGTPIVPLDDLTSDDVVIVPAFGTTIEMQKELESRGIDPYGYDTTCPFVQKVWNRSNAIGREGFTIVVHGKPDHEETRATFSHSASEAPTVVVRDMEETELLAGVITGSAPEGTFERVFRHHASEGFDPDRDLEAIGVVNQTTMLAQETKEIAARLREAMAERYGRENLETHFADTRDTLCYATNENQSATIAMIEEPSDLAIVVGGYNSSNTSHLVELASERMPSYFVRGASEIESSDLIRHFDLEEKRVVASANWIPEKPVVTVALTSGASCPDAIVDEVLMRVVELFDDAIEPENAVEQALVDLAAVNA